jgi:4a-hydroxytetrahydrobiopterin dehydratase
MDEQDGTAASAGAADEKLTRTAASAAAGPAGWRYLLGNLVASVRVDSLGQAATVAAVATAACGELADQHLRLDLRPDRVELSLVDRNGTSATGRDAELATAITTALAGIGVAPAEPVTGGGRRPVQMLEIAIDAMDIAAIRPFWKAVFGYADEPGNAGPQEAIVDPAWELPAIWFQQMDTPRPHRNRIHFDITVAHDEAEARVEAALAAGGTLVSEAEAPSFWVLADVEGNEACVCTWLGRDERSG